jgi:hypothetical protein
MSEISSIKMKIRERPYFHAAQKRKNAFSGGANPQMCFARLFQPIKTVIVDRPHTSAN